MKLLADIPIPPELLIKIIIKVKEEPHVAKLNMFKQGESLEVLSREELELKLEKSLNIKVREASRVFGDAWDTVCAIRLAQFAIEEANCLYSQEPAASTVDKRKSERDGGAKAKKAKTEVLDMPKRKYHWCVLSASPFFDKLYSSKLWERQTGVVNMRFGKPVFVEKAMKFLYGFLPRITIENAKDVLEVAEFLMMDELKAYCIENLKSMNVNTQNCLQLLLLSSLLKFSLQHITKFIFSHLDELMTKDEMLLLEKESVRHIISDPMLSYISREDCFIFLLNWTQHHISRQSDFAELLSCFDADDFSFDVLNKRNIDFLSEDNKILCGSLFVNTNSFCDILVVYPPKRQSSIVKFTGYHLKDKRWFQTFIPVPVGRDSKTQGRPVVKNKTVLVQLNCNSTKIIYFEVENKVSYQKTVQILGANKTMYLSNLSSDDSRLWCVSEERIEKKPECQHTEY